MSGAERGDCHGDEAEKEAEAPYLNHAAMCCLGDNEVAFDEAVRTQLEEAASVDPAVRAAWSSEMPQDPKRASQSVTLDRAESCQPAAGLHLIYAVMLI
jgi:hypothetical protein